MNNLTDIKLTQADIEALPNYRKRTTNGEYSSACPSCGGDPGKDTDRFRFWPEKGNFWCRQCGLEGFISNSLLDLFRVTPEIKAEWERKEAKREAAKKEVQKSTVEQLRAKNPHIIYHHNLNGHSSYITSQWGINQETIDYFKVGYCSGCPLYPHSSSITIPYLWKGELINLRHRLMSPGKKGKYLPEMVGLPTAIFNADQLNQDEDFLILVEGEFKAMVLWQYGYGLPVVAIPGASTFKEKWVRLFDRVERVFVALDPGVEDQAYKIGLLLSKAGVQIRIVTLPYKPDDMFVKYGCDLGTFCKYLELGRLL